MRGVPPFIRIAEVLHGEKDANLVSRPYYRAKDLVKSRLSKLGHGDGQATFCRLQSTA